MYKWHLIFTSFLFFTLFSCQPKTKDEHLLFDGIPLNGKPKDFVSKMKKKRYEFVSTQDDLTIFYGKFGGYDDCRIEAAATLLDNIIFGVEIEFPKNEEWESLSQNYFEIKKKLIVEYGEPLFAVEKFNNSNPQTAADKMKELLNGNCEFISHFSVDNGNIQLTIIAGEYYSRVVAHFVDSKNFRLKNKELNFEDWIELK